MSASAVERYHWDRETYKRAVEAGVFGDADVLLRHGEVVARVSPQGSRHAWAIQVLVKQFKRLPDDAFDLRVQNPIGRTDDDEPEPDLAVVTAKRYVDDHPGPQDVHLVIEVSDTSYRTDLEKVREYAEVGIPLVWIVDVGRQQVEVFSDPDRAARSYLGHVVQTGGELGFDGVRVTVADLF